ncbi:MAG: thioredoxin domain-containing protein [Cytophagaceae bacterium]|nr:thioredoxin domain-containing protein [Cytophagaceae bacterium]
MSGSLLTRKVTDKDQIQGNLFASIELVEYGDYQCPHCGRAYHIIKQIQEALGDKLKFIFRNFPLTNIHTDAMNAAVAAEAAGKQGKFWEMHDMIYEHQDSLSESYLFSYAQDLGLNVKQFQNDMVSAEILSKMEDDFESGIRSGVNGTPSFFINGEKYSNNWDYEPLLNHLKSL